MRTAISFLGFNPRGYSRVTYALPGGAGASFTTELFAEALVHLYQPERLYVLLTPTAESGVPEGATESVWATLQRRVESFTEVIPVRGIPEGAEAADFWPLFEAVTGCVTPGDEVIFDLTHGMRSLPIVALSSLLYLKSTRHIQLRGLLYGAFEARQGDLVPIVDLAPLLQLLEWSYAAETFQRTGEAAPLATAMGSALPALSEALRGLSNALALARPEETVHAARATQKELARSQSPLAELAPLRWLTPDLERACTPLAGSHHTDPRRDPALLWTQIPWNLKQGRVMQAVMLAREWLVTVECLRLGLSPTDRRVRLQMDKRIGSHMQWWWRGEGDGDDALDALPGAGMRAALWKDLASVRNDLVHCGMLENSPTSVELLQRVVRLETTLRAFAKEANIPLSA